MSYSIIKICYLLEMIENLFLFLNIFNMIDSEFQTCLNCSFIFNNIKHEKYIDKSIT